MVLRSRGFAIQYEAVSKISMNTLGRYEIVNKLGTGSMGTVYRARDTILDREVALKTIRTGIDVEPELRERFYREARACARLQHPSIVVVHDLGEIDSMAYIAMELLTGADLRRLIEQRAPISLAAKLEFMTQVCDALGYAHRHGIIHRDVKPSNLFLTDQNRAKVLDFGIARMPSSKLTVAGKILGTPNYMAPEQILGNQSDTRADLFSAAVVFFEFLVYTHPFRSEVIPRRVAEGEPDSLFEHDSKLPSILDKIFTRALARDPNARYRTGDDFATDLRAVADAVSRNASPTFSSVQLPSTREPLSQAPPPSFQPNPSLLSPPPPGEDPAEWRLSEVMRLIPLFETSANNKDQSAARDYLAQLEAIQAIDARFTEAIQVCRARFAELQQTSQPAKAKAAAVSQSSVRQSDSWSGFETGGYRRTPLGDAPTTPKPCPHCNASNRSAAMYCIECGARLPAAPASSTSDAAPLSSPPPRLDLDATIVITPQQLEQRSAAIPPAPEPGPAAWVPEPPPAQPLPVQTKNTANPDAAPLPAETLGRQSWFARLTAAPLSQKQWALVAAAALLVLVLTGLVFKALSPVPLEHAVATARLAPARASVFKAADSNSVIAAASPSDVVNILKLPRVRDQERVSVQVIHRNRPMRPGYMKTAELTAWDSTSPETKLRLILLFQGNGSGSDQEIQAELSGLDEFARAHAGVPAAREARLDIAELTLGRLRQLKDSGSPVAENQLDSVRADLSDAGLETSLADRVNDAQQKLDKLAQELAAPPPPAAEAQAPTAAPTRPKPVDRDKLVKTYLDKAAQLWKDRKFEDAEREVTLAAEVQHDHPEVIRWQKLIQDRKALLSR